MYGDIFIKEDKFKFVMQTSRLYPLEPRGLGSSMVEGLISYVTRLAEAHCTDVGSLISYECVPFFDITRIYSYHSNKVTSTFYKHACSINGFGNLSIEMKNAIEKLTQRTDIKYMTLSKWWFIPRNRGLIKKHKHWCLKCYCDWNRDQTPIYDPLIWSIDLVKICPIHKTLLQTCCPNCFRDIPIIHHHSRTSHCVYCFHSLVTDDTIGLMVSEEEMSFQEWLCENIGDMLVCTKELVDAKSICNALQLFREKYCENNDRVLSRMLRVENKRRQLNAYCRGAATLNFNLLLWFCYVLGTSLITTCSEGTFFQTEKKSNALHISKNYFMLETKWSKIDWVDVEDKLQKYLICSPPRSFKSISRELNIEESYLGKRFPKVAKLLASRYIENRTSQKNIKTQLLKEKIEMVIDDYFKENKEVPTTSMLKKLMGYNHVTFKSELMEHYRERIKDL